MYERNGVEYTYVATLQTNNGDLHMLRDSNLGFCTVVNNTELAEHFTPLASQAQDAPAEQAQSEPAPAPAEQPAAPAAPAAVEQPAPTPAPVPAAVPPGAPPTTTPQHADQPAG